LGHIYNLVARIAWVHLRLLALFSDKLKLFVNGRRETFSILEQSISPEDSVIWVHVASLGEFEQGRPLIEKIRIEYPDHKIVLTFFSPSGYEVKKNTSIADVVTYLPIDTKSNVIRFLEITQPKLAVFVKYEIWPNYLNELQKRDVKAILISAIFTKEQAYFKWYGGFMRNALRRFEHIFVQDEKSKSLLETIEIKNTSISGDTRADRVAVILEQNNTLPFMDAFKKDSLCVVAGSTWMEDEATLLSFINSTKKKLKFILAPHKIVEDKIMGLAASIDKKSALFSNIDIQTIGDYEVLIIDHIGLLTKIYSYADIAYVGGGFASGLHNTLEPAVFGIPVIIGPKYKGFKEAEELIAKKGIISIDSKHGFKEELNRLLENDDYRNKTGYINADYIAQNKGASIQIMDYLRKLL
jgi:3-deoxy-D-manno-octulosonic-acid transferase